MGILSWLRRKNLNRKLRKAADGTAKDAPSKRQRKAQQNGKHFSRRTSMLSDQTEYHSADDMSIVGSPRANAIEEDAALADTSRLYGSDDDGVTHEGSKVLVHPAPDRRSIGCLSPAPALPASKKRLVVSSKPLAGSSFTRRAAQVEAAAALHCFDQPESTSFMIRGLDYMKTHKKVGSEKAIMQLMAIDMFATEFKLYHIARHMELPPLPQISDEALQRGFTPLLIFNIQVPLYNATVFGAHDGQGGSLIYFFSFPEGWHPDQVSNQAALTLLEQFFNDGMCADGAPARDRLKLIPRVSNVEEWYKVGPLSTTEYKLLSTYNDKPVLTRPQQRFYRGPGYLEVDLDVHNWNYIARKAFFNYIPKLSTVVFENAFVLQGNEVAELPEQVLGCVRVYRMDFKEMTSSARYKFPLIPEDPIDCQNLEP